MATLPQRAVFSADLRIQKLGLLYVLFIFPATFPLVGTHYLRSSAEPLQTAQERQFSKTGLPQYAEETRDWKAAIRIYKSLNGSILFVFQLRGEGGAYRRVDFKLSWQ